MADVCTEPEDAVLIATLARALVETAATDGPPLVPRRSDLLRGVVADIPPHTTGDASTRRGR